MEKSYFCVMLKCNDVKAEMKRFCFNAFCSNFPHLLFFTGEKYRAAVSRGRTIMGEDWVHKTWELRNNYTVHATDEEFNQYRLAPFSYTCLSFHGFPREVIYSKQDQNAA